MAICFLCEEEGGELQTHHMIPGFMVNMEPFERWKGCGGSVKLCPKCHKKVTWMLQAIEVILKEELETGGTE